MVRRVGIGATLTAVLVFSSLLLSNFTLLAAADGRAIVGERLDEMSLVSDTAAVMAGTQALSLLGEMQSFLSSRVLPCNAATNLVSSVAESLRSSEREGEDIVSESIMAGGDLAIRDNLSMLRPFNGSSAGNLNFRVQVQSSGSYPAGDVIYHRSETHSVTLPLSLAALTSFCEMSVKTIASMLSSTTFANCTAGSVRPLLATEDAILRAQAFNRGLESSLAYNITLATACTVNYVLRVSQSGVSGPLGPFSVRVEELGSAVLQVFRE